MIDELTLLKEMLGDLTNAGIWGICIYVGYKLVIFGGTAGSIVYLGKLIVTKIYDYAKSDFTKAEAKQMKLEANRRVDNAEEARKHWENKAAEANRERDEVKSMYKILKMKSEAGNDSKSDA